MKAPLTARLRLFLVRLLLPSGFRVVRKLTPEETMIRG